MYEKECVACGAAKAPEDFYTSDRKCKDCRKAMVRLARASNIDKVREYDKQRAMLPHRVAARKEYAQTPEGKATHNRAKQNWQARNAKERAAHIAVGNALRRGTLAKHPCFICGATDVEGHHPDYDAPLSVVWLCVPHHSEIHAEFPRT